MFQALPLGGSACIAYLNTIAPSNKTTLYRHINSGKPYQGYGGGGKISSSF
jgi:hypothetical protein